jgi:hypothetical protein
MARGLKGSRAAIPPMAERRHPGQPAAGGRSFATLAKISRGEDLAGQG